MPRSLADMLVLNDQNLAEQEATELLEDAPLLMWLAATISSNGHKHSYLVKTGAPTVGYRTMNNGTNPDHATREKRETELKIVSANSLVDKKEAQNYQYGPDEYVDRDVRDHLQAALADTENQIINGIVGGNSNAYTGFADALDDSDDAMVYNAGGTGSACTSVYLVRSTDMLEDVAIVGQGNGTNPLNARIQIGVGPTIEQAAFKADGSSYPALFTECEGWLGVQVGAKYSLARLANINAANPLTDVLLAKLWAKIPASKRRNKSAWRFVMNTTAQMQLQEGRTATSESGKEADIPDNWQGVEFVVSDNIGDNETALTPA